MKLLEIPYDFLPHWTPYWLERPKLRSVMMISHTRIQFSPELPVYFFQPNTTFGSFQFDEEYSTSKQQVFVSDIVFVVGCRAQQMALEVFSTLVLKFLQNFSFEWFYREILRLCFSCWKQLDTNLLVFLYFRNSECWLRKLNQITTFPNFNYFTFQNSNWICLHLSVLWKFFYRTDFFCNFSGSLLHVSSALTWQAGTSKSCCKKLREKLLICQQPVLFFNQSFHTPSVQNYFNAVAPVFLSNHFHSRGKI